jgi:hypothetical protein
MPGSAAMCRLVVARSSGYDPLDSKRTLVGTWTSVVEGSGNSQEICRSLSCTHFGVGGADR